MKAGMQDEGRRLVWENGRVIIKALDSTEPEKGIVSFKKDEMSAQGEWWLRMGRGSGKGLLGSVF